MKKNILMILMTAMLVIVLSACGSNNKASNNADKATTTDTTTTTDAAEDNVELTIKHKLGEATLKKNPKKVVVFDYGVLDSLDKLGVEVMSVPQASIPSYLSKYEDSKYENAGSLKEPDFEKINALKPDVIFISGRQQDAYEELNKIAPTIFMGVDTTNYMESFTENMTKLGQIFGKEAEVETELASVNETVASVKEKADNGKNALIILANEGNISAYGSGSRFGLIHDVLGVTPVDPDIEVSTHGQPVTFEYIAEKNPDYLFVVDRGAAVASEGQEAQTTQQLIENDLVKKTKAYQEGHIIYLNADFWYLSGGGLVSVSSMVQEVADNF